MKLSNLLPAFLLVLIASAFEATPARAAFTLQPNIQEVSRPISDDKSEFKWTLSDKSHYLAHLISDHRDTASALILSRSPNENFGKANNLSFEFHKNERGVVFKQTANPMLRVEYIIPDTGRKLYKTIILEAMHREPVGGYVKATVLGLLTDWLPEGERSKAVVNRIAVVARAENNGIVQVKYADFDLKTLLINGIGFNPLTVELNSINSKKDPLTNF